MRKIEREELQRVFNQIGDMDRIKEETLKELQELNVEHGDGQRWCSWKACLDGVIKENPSGIWRGRAEYQYERFLKAEGGYDALMVLGQALADIGFWKNQQD